MQEAVTTTVGSALSTAFFGYVMTIVVSLAAAVLIWGIVKTLERMQGRGKAAAASAAVSISVAAEPEPADETAQHAAVIAAAVYAHLGAHRLVHIAEAASSVGWRTTGRAIHQTSHSPRRSAD